MSSDSMHAKVTDCLTAVPFAQLGMPSVVQNVRYSQGWALDLATGALTTTDKGRIGTSEAERSKVRIA